MSRAQRLANNTLSSIGARALAMALMVVSMRVLARGLGEDRYGVFLLTLALLSNLQLLSFGVPSGLIRFVAHARGAGDQRMIAGVIRTSFWFYAAIGFVVAAVLALLGTTGLDWLALRPQDREVAQGVLLLTAVWSLLSWPFQIFGQVLQGLQEFGRYNFAMAMQAITLNVAYIIVGVGGFPVWCAVLAMALSQGLLFTMNWVDVRRLLPGLRWWGARASRSVRRELLGFSAAMFVLGAAGKVFYELDQPILSFFVSTAAVTQYAFLVYPLWAVREATGWLTGAMMPAFTEARAAGDATFARRLILRGSRLTMLFTVSLCAVGCGVLRAALGVWMGGEYASLAPLGQALLIGYAVSVTFAVPGQALIGAGKLRLPLIAALTSAFANLLLSLILVRPFGLWGVVLGTVGAVLISVPIALGYFRELQVNLPRFLGRVALPVYAWTGFVGLATWQAAERVLGYDTNAVEVLALAATALFVALAGGALLVLPAPDRGKLRALLAAAFTRGRPRS